MFPVQGDPFTKAKHLGAKPDPEAKAFRAGIRVGLVIGFLIGLLVGIARGAGQI